MGNISQVSTSRSIRKQLDPVCFVISTEGKDELDYFSELEKLIPRRFHEYYKFHLVEKEDINHSAISYICKDMDDFIASGKSKFRKLKASSYIVFDYDKNFEANHIQSTLTHIRESKQKGYFTICSNPCFDLWLILHYIDITSTEDIESILQNKRNYVKQYLHQVRNNETYPMLVKRYKYAIENAEKLVRHCTDRDGVYPFSCLKTEVFFLLSDIVKAGLLE